MTMFGSQWLDNPSRGYEISQSIRFNAADSAYLTRTPGSASNRKTWTFSFWWKVNTSASATGSGYRILQANSTEFGWSDENDNLYLIDGSVIFQTTQVFRDTTAWQHIVLAVDTTDSTAADRVKLYINGSQVTSFVSGPTVAQDFTFDVNDNTAQNIGKEGSNYLDAYVAEIQLVDGTQLAASSFGKTNSDGVWVPKAYTGSYGTNGFFIDGRDSSDLGDDESGNGNDFTSSGLAADDQVTDTPTENYATLTPLIPVPSGTISNGNLNYTRGSTAAHGSVGASFTLPTTGKWYWEVTAAATGGNNEAIGVANILNNPQLPAAGAEIGSRTGDFIYRSSAAKVSGGTSASYGATFTSGDIIGVAWNSDDGEITFFKNNSTQGVAYSSISQEVGKYVPADSQAQTGVTAFNFGQLDFTYTPPTGFKALNTANLPASTIADGTANFQTTLYTGDGNQTQTLTQGGNSTFNPDFIWIKNRSNAYSHNLNDAVRGYTGASPANAAAVKVLAADATDLEGLGDTITTAQQRGFVQESTSDGFIVNKGTAGSQDGFYTNASGHTYAAWQWLANGGGSSNEDGSINTTATSVNTTAGFSMSTYTGTGSNATVGHGLGVTPSVVLVMPRSNGDHKLISNWADGVTAFTEKMLLDTDQAADSTGTTQIIGGSSTTFSLGTDTNVNGSSRTYVGYCWAEVEGYSKMGTYTGNGSTDGPFIYTGFKPAFFMVKREDSADNWAMYDATRDPFNVTEKYLLADTAAAEATFSTAKVDFLSNGFKWRGTVNFGNVSGGTYVFMAFAEHPFGGDGVAPATAR